MAAPASVASDVWTGISGAEKMRILQTMLRGEVDRIIPALLKEPN
jgi:6-phosphogluconolactonase/glucosamine-6-phosphate isomerase/deaminase